MWHLYIDETARFTGSYGVHAWILAGRVAERMLVMDWLPGPEVSVDLLCWRGRPLAHAAKPSVSAGQT